MMSPPPIIRALVSRVLVCSTMLLLSYATVSGRAEAATTPSSGYLSLSPTVLWFGPVDVGKQVSHPDTLTNTGSASITITSSTLGNSQFSISGLSLPLTLAAGQAVTITVTFTPTQVGHISTTASFSSNASNNPTTLALNGSSTSSGTLSTNPATIAFGAIPVGSNASAYETITNSSGLAVVIESSGGLRLPFSTSGLKLPYTLNAGSSVTFTVTFAPTQAGNYSQKLTLFAGTTTATVALTGMGSEGGVLSVNPTALNFGTVTVGTSSALTGTLTVTSAAVTVSSAVSSSSEFVLSGMSFPLTLQPNTSATYTVTFSPQMSGSASGTLTFSSNASNSPTTQSLSGTGMAPPVYSVELTWDAPSGNIKGYNVYRGTIAGGPYIKINSSLDTTTSYSDTTVQYSTTYYYTSTSVGQDGKESAYSNQTKAVIPPL